MYFFLLLSKNVTKLNSNNKTFLQVFPEVCISPKCSHWKTSMFHNHRGLFYPIIMVVPGGCVHVGEESTDRRCSHA